MRFGIETESKESALQMHLERADEVERREGGILDSISSGNFPPDVFSQLDHAIMDKIAVVCDGIPRERVFVIGFRRFPLGSVRLY